MKPKILVVEDNADNLETLVAYLEFSGYETIQATDGEIAIDKIEKEKPDVVFLDLSIPKIDGWEVAKKIRANEKVRDIIVIAFSAMALPQEMEKAIQCGCDTFIAKPMPPEKLIEEMNKLLEEK